MSEQGATADAPAYWRLSAFYFFYFAALGSLIPYWGLYLRSLGFDAEAIGSLLAVIMATKIVAPNVWGWIADRRRQHMAIVRLASWLAVIAFAGVLLGHDYGWLMLVMVCFSFFWNASLPQFEAVTMNHLGHETHRYSRIRLWGSVGFVVAVAGLGLAIDRLGAAILPWVVLAALVAIAVASLVVADRGRTELVDEDGGLTTVLRRPAVLALLGVCFLMQLSHGPYYAFYSIYLDEHGYGRDVIGLLWALGVVAEIVVFLLMHRLMPRLGLRSLLLMSLLAASLRWWLIAGFVDLAFVMVLAQLLHAASFGIYHAVAITFYHRWFPGRLQGRGQALYSSISFGAGGAAGSFFAGLAWDDLGAETTFLSASVVSLLAFALAWFGIGRGAGLRAESAMDVVPSAQR